jgi:hypothetical protein
MNDSISRELGHFQGQSGRKYVLDVNVLADGSSLTPGNPRLKVEVHPMFYEDVMIGGAIQFLLMDRRSEILEARDADYTK